MARKSQVKYVSQNIYKRGNAFYARFSVNGQIQRVSLRTGDLREAKKRLKAIRQKAVNHFFGIQEAPKWENAVVHYCQSVLNTESVKENTAKRYMVSLRQIDPYFKGIILQQITPSVIGNYVSARQGGGATNATIRRDLTTISRVLACARSFGMIESNPTDLYDRGLIKEKRKVIRAPSDSSINEAVSLLIENKEFSLASIMRFLRDNGMRAGEALRATWDNIHNGQLTIYETKNGRARTIEVNLSAFNSVKSSGRMFPTLPENSGSLAVKWRNARKYFPENLKFRIHDLRHAYAISEVRKGRDIYDLSHHLGHSSVKVTEIYLGYAAGARSVSRKTSR